MSHNPARRPSTVTQKRHRFLQHLWDVFTASSSRSRASSHPARHFESLEERRVLATMYAVNLSNNLLTFDSATPGTIQANVAITGLGANEEVVGIDVRPATGGLYAIGLTDDGATRTGKVYVINPLTATASPVGVAPFSTTLADTSFFGMDFNPTVDRIRIVNNFGQNLRVNPNDGNLVGTDTNLSISTIEAIAYDRNAGGTTITTLYALNYIGAQLAIIGGIDGNPSPNGGVVTNLGTTGIPGALDFQMDIESGTNIARLATKVGALQTLYTVNLATGGATSVGAIGNGLLLELRGLTSASTSLAVVGSAGDDNLIITATGANSGTYTLNGGAAVAFTGLASFSFLGGLGNDTLTINNPASGLFAPFNGIDYLGGGQAGDALNLIGGGGAGFNETYSVGTTTPPIGAGPGNNGNGLLRFTGPTPVDIRFTGLAPIVDTVAVASQAANAASI